jgi:hypothetical protein
VQQDGEVKPIGHEFDHGVFRHELGVVIEQHPVVVGEQQTVAGAVDQQERAQEKTGQTHQKFVADRGIEKLYDPGHNIKVKIQRFEIRYSAQSYLLKCKITKKVNALPTPVSI